MQRQPYSRSGMASRRKVTSGKQARKGLRSQKPVLEEVAWDTMDEEETASAEGAEARSPRVKPESKGMESDVVALMRTFLTAQSKREEGLIYELRGLRESLQRSVIPETSPSQSLRLDLLTPAASRIRGPSVTQNPTLSTQRAADSPPPPPMRPESRMPAFQEGEDVENYLRRFERLAKTWGWPEEEWANRLVPLLTGKALEAYLAMDEDRAEVYKDLREALMTKFDLSTETYRQRFRQTSIPAGETPTETYNRLKGLYKRWIRPEQCTKEEVGEAIILEQLLRVLPLEVRTWVGVVGDRRCE